jgi:hypothetical protein
MKDLTPCRTEDGKNKLDQWAVVKESLTTQIQLGQAATIKQSLTVQFEADRVATAEKCSVVQMPEQKQNQWRTRHG